MSQYSAYVIALVVVLAGMGMIGRRWKWLRFVGIVISIGVVLSEYGSLGGRGAGVSMLALLGALKTMELSKRRDVFIFLLMLTLLLVGQLLEVDSLLMLFYSLGVLLLYFYLLLSLASKRAWNILEKERLRYALSILAFSFLLAAGLFLIFPRFHVNNIFAHNNPTMAQVGPGSSQLNPGDFSKIVANPDPIFRASFTGNSRPNYEELYWRGSVLGWTDGFRWRRGHLSRQREHSINTGKKGYAYEVDFAVLQEGMLFALQGTDGPKVLGRSQLIRHPGDTFQILPRGVRKVSYKAKTVFGGRFRLDNRERKKYLQLPPNISARVMEFASELKRSTDPAFALLAHFRQGGFSYTLKPKVIDQRDDRLGIFLFERKEGYCEHYASAFAILARLMGIPSRIVVGLHGGLHNPIGDYYLLRSQDAHAWVEIWRDSTWQRIDRVTSVAPDRITFGSEALFRGALRPVGTEVETFLKSDQKSWWRRFSFAVDMVYYRFNRQFIGLDYQKQKDFLKRWGIIEYVSLKMMTAVVLLTFCVCLLSVVWLNLVGRGGSELDGAYIRLCDKIKSAGFEREHWMGPRDFFERVSSKVKNHGDLKDTFDCYMKVKYAGQNHLLSEFVRRVKRLKIV